jgi:AcrR family transcriptional regulator
MTAAVELFAQRGFAATGIRDIAAAAGLSSSSLYEYMSTKDDLLVEIMSRTIEPLIRAGKSMTETSTSPEWLLAALTQNHVWFHARYPNETMVTDTELRALDPQRRDQVVALRDLYEGVWRSAVAAGVAASTFDVSDTDVCARCLISLCTGVGRWYRPSARLNIEQLCAIHVELVLGTVGCQRDGRSLRAEDLSLPDPACVVDTAD